MINEPVFSEFSEGFVATLLDFCEAPGPGPTFVSGLEQKLLSHQSVLLRPTRPEHPTPRRWWKVFTGSLTRHAWQYAIVMVLIALSAALIAIGPQRVLAQVQQWLGYLPGVGFINPEQVRVLAAPIEARQGSSFLQVQQVIAGPDQTVVVATLTGSTEEIPEGIEWAHKVTLIMPDGQRLIPMSSSQQGRAGQLRAEIVYVHLPQGVNQVTLVMPKLPNVTGGTQEFWSVILPLIEVRQQTPNANGSPSPGNLAVAPYTPRNAPVSNQGVTVRLLQSAHSGQETGLLLQFDWSNPTWDYRGASVELRDNQGRIYERLERPPGASTESNGMPRGQTTAQEMMRFTPLDPAAQQVALTLKTIYFEDHPKAQFRFDPGEHPTLDQTWSYTDDPAMRFTIAGFQVQVLKARLTSAPAGSQLKVRNPPEATLLPQPTALPEFAFRLEFILEITPQAQSQISIGVPNLAGKNPGTAGSYSEDNENRAAIYMDLSEIPTTPLTIQLSEVFLSLQGGWQFYWDLPEATANPRSP